MLSSAGFGAGTSYGELTKAVSVSISIAVSIPAKNWRDTRHLVVSDTMPEFISDCIESIPRQDLNNESPGKVLSGCLADELYPGNNLIHSADDLRVIIAGI